MADQPLTVVASEPAPLAVVKSEPAPDFKQSDTSPNDLDPNSVGTFVRHLWTGINPVQVGQLLPFPKALGGSGMENPLFPQNLVKQMHAVKLQADALWDKGDKVGASAKYVESVIPLLGPMLSQQGDEWQQGKYAAAAGDTAAMATNAALMTRGATKAPAPAKAAAEATPAEAAVQWGKGEGLPIDAGTATGNAAVKGVQFMADRTLAGSLIAKPAAARAADAFAAKGGALADDVHGIAVAPEQAGQAVSQATQDLIGTLHGQASKAYDTLRQIEADPKYSQMVETAPIGSKAHQTIAGALAAEDVKTADGSTVKPAGAMPSDAELRGMREIAGELESQPFTRGRMDSQGDYRPGVANASVYHAIQQAAPGLTDITGKDMLAGIRRTLETGEWNNASRGALVVAKRMVDPQGMLYEAPRFSAQQPLLGSQQRVGLPVDVSSAAQALRPIYEQLLKKRELAGTLMGGEARAVTSLDGLINGPRVVPLSTADAVLSDLKSLARGALLPELRSTGQGIAAEAVKQLDRVVRATATRAGPDVLRALEEGRAATVAKHQIGDLYETYKTEPVKLYQQLTAPKDGNVAFLRRVAEAAPSDTPKIARAKLDELLTMKPDKAQAEWAKLGAGTKRLLFPSPGQGQALDHFFRLQQMVNENVNPSGTGPALLHVAEGAVLYHDPVQFLVAQVGSAGASKVLHTQAGVQALTRLLSLRLKAPGAPRLAQLAAATQLERAASAAGVPLTLPVGAQGPTPSETGPPGSER